MDEQQGQFLKATYAVQNEIGRARVLDIATHLGLDIINSKADRYLYHETALELREGGYIDCLAFDEGVTCGIVRLTAEGYKYVESKRRSPFIQRIRERLSNKQLEGIFDVGFSYRQPNWPRSPAALCLAFSAWECNAAEQYYEGAYWATVSSGKRPWP